MAACSRPGASWGRWCSSMAERARSSTLMHRRLRRPWRRRHSGFIDVATDLLLTSLILVAVLAAAAGSDHSSSERRSRSDALDHVRADTAARHLAVLQSTAPAPAGAGLEPPLPPPLEPGLSMLELLHRAV